MSGVAAQLDTSRQALLDLSTRNRLLHVPKQRKSAKIIEVYDELSTEIYRLLVKEGKTLGFLPGRDKAATDETAHSKRDDFGELPQPGDNEELDERGVAKRHRDRYLQTMLTSEGLQKRLLSMFYDAITFEEEQGVNILYLAIGSLTWFEDDNSDIARHAPLVLIPVSLERGTAGERFKLKWRDEDCAANLSLQAKMKAEFGLILPDLPEDDDVDVAAYMQAVKEIISVKKRFEVTTNDAVLGFFSFAKFLMYRDLDPTHWPEAMKLDVHPIIAGLMRDGFPAAEGMIGEEENVDDHLSPAQMSHVVDADSSQTLAIEEVRRARNLVIQGPPGTGKSQTITNIIAAAVADGKRVLFVAEKMAALEVVHRRMSAIGLGPLCLELHSSKSNKRTVLEELKRTRELARPRSGDADQAAKKITVLQGQLNAHVSTLHAMHQPSGLTTYEIIGHSTRLKQDGVDARGIVLENPVDWSPDELHEREQLLADVSARIKEIGAPSAHPWCGVSRPALLPNEYDRLCDDLAELRTMYDVLVGDVKIVEACFPVASATLNSLHLANGIARTVTALSNADYPALANPLWQNSVPLLNELAKGGAKYQSLKQTLSETIIDAAWTTDLHETRQHLAVHGTSMLRFAQSKYRRSLALLKSLVKGPLLTSHAERLALVDDIIAAQRLEKLLHDNNDAGMGAFGRLWQGSRSEWEPIAALMEWRNALPVDSLPSDFLKQCASIKAMEQWKEVAPRLQQSVPAFFAKLKAMLDWLQFDVKTACGKETIENVGRDEFDQRLSSWAANTEALSKWIAFKSRYDKLFASGVSAIATKMWSGDLVGNKAISVFERAYFDALTEAVFTAHPPLREFDGDHHNSIVANFRENDRYRIEQNRIEIRCQHFNGMPRADGGIGALGVLSGEFAKKRNHMPIRKLMKKAGPAIQALKPVFMMSPLSVAQFLEPGAIQFDLLVMDEASQVEPVDALGAIARAKQVVVVGDTRQLPPTRFFSRMTANIGEDGDENEDDNIATTDVESILSLCLARGLPERMLRWHYRSKHQSLIAVSNKEFYDNKLFIVPSPYDAASGMGLKFNYLPDAVFESGESATNPIEAKAVAEAVIHHAKATPNLSLGVGCFSVKQRQAILDYVEVLRRANPDTEYFFNQANRDEPFFIKNLENIQGDERDVIFISVGYGRKKDGTYTASFGPLNSEGGERRMNVLISRAKRRCEVFSSITADHVDLERAKGAGVAALKMFLKFAETGKLDYGHLTERDADSPFEEQVAAALRARGYDVRNQIGLAGFFIDLAVTDPDMPGRFVLGIECDGYAYHCSRSARDRDRLRQAVLEDHGWIIHRIWSTDWFHRPKDQLEKTIAAIEAAKKKLAAHDAEQQHTARPVFEIVSHEADELQEDAAPTFQHSLSVPYHEAQFPVPSHVEPHLVTDQDMAIIVAKIVDAEGPVHESEVTARVKLLWGLGRAGSRIQKKVYTALAYAKRNQVLMNEGDFWFKVGSPVLIRDRSNAASPSLRKPEALPPQEIKRAVLMIVEMSFGANRDQVPTEVVRLLGFKATSSQLRELVEKQIDALIKSGALQEVDGHLSIVNEAKQA